MFLILLYFYFNLANPTPHLTTKSFVCMMNLLKSEDLLVTFSDSGITNFDKCGNISTYNHHLSHVKVDNDKYGVYEFWNPNIFHKLSFIHIEKLKYRCDYGGYERCVWLSSIIIVRNKMLNENRIMYLTFYFDYDNMITSIEFSFNNNDDKDFTLDTNSLFTI